MSDNDFPLDPHVLAEEIAVPLERWPGNCHGVATEILNLLPVRGMRLARGHWHGPVHGDSVFSAGPSQHTWLELEDGRILDPTRWAFTNPHKPRIYLGLCDHYDEFGAQLDAGMSPTIGRVGANYVPVLQRMRTEHLEAIFNRPIQRDSLDDDAWHHLASTFRNSLKETPERLENPATMYRAVADAGCKGMIQIDKWMAVMEPETITCNPQANRFFDVPPREERTEVDTLLRIFNRFLSIEERDDIESELEELGFDMERDLWGSLNWLERFKELPIEDLPNVDQCVNCMAVIAGDLLGAGFAKDLEVERFARSLGWSRDDFDDVLTRFGNRAGYDIAWG